VAVAERTAGEVWVVNHLSDSVSVVDVASDPPRVVRTLLVGDEPRDIVFAGPGGNRAFITTAHRGQHRTDPSIAAVPGAGDPQLTTPGIGRADVWVFDATNLGSALGGVPLRIVTLFGDTPRALAKSPDGNTVYAAIFKSGNGTTVIAEPIVCDGFAAAGPCVKDGVVVPGGLPGPSTNFEGKQAPETGLIVKYDPTTDQWLDPLGRDWGAVVQFDLPDEDVFAIDATSLTQTGVFTGVGTTLFNMVANPVSGTVYVSNTEARNEVRFEGPGIYGGTTVNGHLAESRITVLSGSNVLPRHLNSHIPYETRPAPPGVKQHSLATPVDMVVSPDGSTLYVAAFGSGRIGVIDTADLEAGTFDPTTASANYISLSGGGPAGLALDPSGSRLFVLTRFDNTVSIVDLGSRTETQRVSLHNPEPAKVVQGRPFLYDANLTSSNGEASCSSCHIFGDMDDLAWDLGNPDAPVKSNPIPINLGVAVTSGVFVLESPINGTGNLTDFHPMKGPMTTQTLRGMNGSGAMHWRGDRANPPGTPASAFDEVRSFNNFNEAFPGLVGREDELPAADMQKFTDFALEIMLPPNPNRPLSNTLTPLQQNGRNFFFGPRLSDGIPGSILGVPLGFTCEGCHRLDAAQKFFGTDGRASFENEVQIVKIPHLRNLYQKVGMFGGLDTAFTLPLNTPHQGPQIRGFGYLHDGSVDTLFRFFNATVFSNTSVGGSAVGFQSNTQRREMEQFMLAFDTNFAPIVGQQTTLTNTNAAIVGPRIDLLVARAAAGECDVVVKGVVAGEARGFVRQPGGLFVSDRADELPLSDAAVRALAATPGQALTYTCVPPGEGQRVGVDRDLDGFYDRDELDAGSDPADPNSFPGQAPDLTPVPTKKLSLSDTSPAKRGMSFASATKGLPVPQQIVPPAPGSAGDPTVNGGALVVYNAAGLTNDETELTLPASGWTLLGKPSSPKGWRFRSANGPVRSLVIKPNSLTAKVRGATFGYTLDEAQQGTVAVFVRLGANAGWCAVAPARTAGNPPSSAKFDKPGKFVSAKNIAAPGECAALPGGGSPSGAFLE
jgi:YVTN family beta-propeller protein